MDWLTAILVADEKYFDPKVKNQFFPFITGGKINA